MDAYHALAASYDRLTNDVPYRAVVDFYRQILEQEQREHPLRGFVEIMIHEQYFYEDYGNYEPDYEERIMAGCRWCHERGMKGAFFSDALA